MLKKIICSYLFKNFLKSIKKIIGIIEISQVFIAISMVFEISKVIVFVIKGNLFLNYYTFFFLKR
jgi:hypothetical protein